MKTYTYKDIAEQFGKELADKALSSNAEPTGRLMYPGYEGPEHFGKTEYAFEPVYADNGDVIQAYFYLTDEEEQDIDSYLWDENAAEFQLNR